MVRASKKQSGFVHLPAALKPDFAATSLRSLRMFMAACLAVVLVLFAAFAAWRHQEAHAEAEQQLQQTLTLAHEHALRVLDTNETLLRFALALVQADDDAQVIAERPALHAQLREMSAGKPQIQSIWVQGPDGRPLVGNRMLEPPASMDVSGRAYFAWHRDKRGGVVASGLMTGPDGERFFNISRGRVRSNGDFAGLVSVGLYASYFTRFHEQLGADQAGLAITLFRNDGVVYSRWPALPGLPARMSPQGEVLSRVLAGENAGVIRDVSSLDGKDRMIVFRRLGDYPVFLGAGRDMSLVHAALYTELARIAGFVLVPVLLLVVAAYVAMRRTRDALDAARLLQEESNARRQVEDALLQAQKMEALGRLTGGVAHDFNNALMVISGNLHLLRRTLPDAPPKHLDAIGRAVESATKLTRQLLAFSRRQPLAPQVLRLQEHLPGLRDLLQPTLGSRVQLDIAVAPDTPPICVDPAELELALINLAVNARDAMPEGGSFHLEAGFGEAPWGPAVWIEAADTGTGMPADVAAKAFDPFFTTKPLGKGTGLGLGQVQSLCRRAGGDAVLASALGQGTRVTLRLPPTELPLPAAGAGEREVTVIRKSVLLVEDNAEVAAVVMPVLEKLGCSVVHRDCGDAALQWLRSGAAQVDLVLTDVVMPGDTDGIALVRTVQKTYPQLKVVVMTGYAEQIDALHRMGYEVLAKPFTPQSLADALERALAAPVAAA